MKPHNAALLIVDVQNDFCAGGALEVPDANAIIAVINTLIPQFNTCILTQDWHPRQHLSFASSHPGKQPFTTTDLPYGEQLLWPDHCVQGSTGAAFHPQLNTTNAALVLRKGFRREIDSYSAFYENDHNTATGLSGYLRNRGLQTLYLVGLATDFCVAWSAIDGMREGFNVNVIENACKAIDRDGSLAAAWEQMHAVNVKRMRIDV